jgi:hypothetical protein
MSNNASLQAPACGVVDNSSSSTAMMITGGAKIDAKSIGIVGNASTSNGGSITPAPMTGIAAVSDPLASVPPPSFSSGSCLANPGVGGQGGAKLALGPSTSGGTVCYNGLTIANGDSAAFRPGLYIVNGTFTVVGGSTITGTGVTFYISPGGSLSLSNGATLNLTAPTSGTYDGILFYQDPSNRKAASLQGGANSTLEGILYFPSANLTVANGSKSQIYAPIVAGSLTIAGGALFQDNDYTTINQSSPLASTRPGP